MNRIRTRKIVLWALLQYCWWTVYLLHETCIIITWLCIGARNPVRGVRRLLPAVLCRLRHQGHLWWALPAVPATARPHRAGMASVQRIDAESDHLPRVQPGLPARLRHAAALRLLSAGDRGVEAAAGGVVRRRTGHVGGSPGSGRESRCGDDGSDSP